MINKDELARWKVDPTTVAVMDELNERMEWLIAAMSSGQFFDPDSMSATHGATAHALGEIEGLQTFFRIIEGMTDDDVIQGGDA